MGASATGRLCAEGTTAAFAGTAPGAPDQASGRADAGRFERGIIVLKTAGGLKTIEAMQNSTQPAVLWFPAAFLHLRAYCLITPQAIRLPELPLGSVFMSSAFSCTISEVPPLASREFGAPGCSVTPVRIQVAEPR